MAYDSTSQSKAWASFGPGAKALIDLAFRTFSVATRLLNELPVQVRVQWIGPDIHCVAAAQERAVVVYLKRNSSVVVDIPVPNDDAVRSWSTVVSAVCPCDLWVALPISGGALAKRATARGISQSLRILVRRGESDHQVVSAP